MRTLMKTAMIAGVVGAVALGSMTTSDARGRGWVAGAAGFAVGAAIGAAAANANAGYYGYGSGYYAPGYAYEPAYAAPAYDSYAYSPGYYGYNYDASTQSAPAHTDARGGYNSNTLAPWQDKRMQGTDY